MILVLSGGGLRAYYGLGYASALLEEGVVIKEIIASSASAGFALALLSGTHDEVVSDFISKRRRLVEIRNNRIVLTPHLNYLSMLERFVDIEKVKNSPINLVFSTLQLPDQLVKERLKIFIRLAWYFTQDFKQNTSRAIEYSKKIGLIESTITKDKLLNFQDAVDAVLSSSSIPYLVKGPSNTLDGSLTWLLPLHHASQRHPGERVLAVSFGDQYVKYAKSCMKWQGLDIGHIQWATPKLVTVGAWSYGNPEGIKTTYKLGREDGRKWAEKHKFSIV